MIRLSLRTVLISLIVLLFIPGISSAMTLDQVATTCMGGGGSWNGTFNDAWYLWVNGTRAMAGNLSMGTYAINDVADPTQAQDAATKNYVDTHASNYNASYWTGTNYNASYATITYVGEVNTSMKNYVDGQVSGASNYNASYNALIRSDYVYTDNTTYTLDSELSATNTSMKNYVDATNTSMKSYVDSLPANSYNASYNALIRSDYVYTGNGSYILGSNTSYMLVDGSRAMTGNLSLGSKYINNVITGGLGSDATNKSYVDSAVSGMSNYNASYNDLIRSDYVYTGNGSYVLTNNGSYITGGNTSYFLVDGSRAMTGNLSLGSKYINSVISGNLGSDAVNKSYVDSMSSNYNASYVTTTNTSYVLTNNGSYVLITNTSYALDSEVTAVNTSMKNYVDLVNTSMKSYVDSTASNYNVSYNALIRSDYVYTGNTSYVLTDNTSYALDSEVSAVNTSMKNYVDSVNTSMKSYVDGGLPYVASNNGTLVLTTNGSYITGGNTSYFLVDGSRALTGNMSSGSKYINNLISGKLGSDAVNKSYVDSVASSYNASYVETTNGTYVLTNNGSYVLTSNTSYFLVDGSRALTGNMNAGSKLITSLITSASDGTSATNKTYVDAVNTSMKNYIDGGGLPYVASNNGTLVLTTNTSYVLGSNTTHVLTSNTSYMLVDGSRAMTGNLSMGSKYINNVITGSLGSDAVNKSYIDSGLPYVAANNGTLVLTTNNTYVKTNNASYVLTSNTSYVLGSNTTHVVNPVYGYITLMAGSAIVTNTNAITMNQTETTTNKNNYIALNFTDGGSEVGMWMVDFPADWNYSANVVFTPIWSAASGSGTVHFDVSGKLFPDDAALDTALSAIGDSQDTLITAGDLHVAPDTTGAAITSVGTGGNTAIIKVTRDSATDTLSGTAHLIGLRVKYSRILA
jgi:hypothetical protein